MLQSSQARGSAKRLPDVSTFGKRLFNIVSSLAMSLVGPQGSHSWTMPTISWKSFLCPKQLCKIERQNFVELGPDFQDDIVELSDRKTWPWAWQQQLAQCLEKFWNTMDLILRCFLDYWRVHQGLELLLLACLRLPEVSTQTFFSKESSKREKEAFL